MTSLRRLLSALAATAVLLAVLAVSARLLLTASVTGNRPAFIRERMQLGETGCPTLPGKITFWTDLLAARQSNDATFDADGNGTVSVADAILLLTALLQVQRECGGHFLFATSQSFSLSPNFSPSTQCQIAAAQAGFGGLWIPLLSTSALDARDRITVNGPVYSTRPIGGQPGRYMLLAENAEELWSGTLRHPVCNEFGDCSTIRAVRTGSRSDGTKLGESAADFCGNWTSTTGTPTAVGYTHDLSDLDDGVPGAPNGDWLRRVGAVPSSCASASALYCFQQTQTSVCGNGHDEIGEECDWGAGNRLTCAAPYGGSCQICHPADCTLRTVAGGFCGDGITQHVADGGPELCDGGEGCDAQCHTPGQMVFTSFGTPLILEIGGIAGADAFCQQAADSRQFPGTWRAILSDSQTNARDRIPVSGPVYNARMRLTDAGYVWDKQVVALDAQEFWSGTLRHPLHYDQNGLPLSPQSPTPVLTGSDATGNKLAADPSAFCGDWTQAVGQVPSGQASGTGSLWLYDPAAPVACDGGRVRLYCMSLP